MSIDIDNPFTVPNIIDLDYYKKYKNIPLSSNQTEQDATIEKVIKTATMNINVVCGNTVFKKYNVLKEQEELSETDQYNLYCLQQAICELVEYYIDTGMQFNDKTLSTSGNLPLNLTSSSSNAIWEAKRLDIIEKLVSGKWYQSVIVADPKCEHKKKQQVDLRQLILQLDTIYKRIDENNNFAGHKLVDLGNLTANVKNQTLIQDFNLFNCLWNGKLIPDSDFVISVANNPVFDSENITIQAEQIVDISGKVISSQDLPLGTGIFINETGKVHRWYAGNNQFRVLSTIGHGSIRWEDLGGSPADSNAFVSYMTVNYYNKTAIDTMFADYYTSEQVDELLESYYTKDAVDILLSNKQDKLPTYVNDKYLKVVNGALSWEDAGITSVSWDDITDKPELYTKSEVDTLLDAKADDSDLTNEITARTNADTNLQNTKQDTLVSGINIKTINNQTLLGSGNIEISGGSGVPLENFIEGENVSLSKDTTNNTLTISAIGGSGGASIIPKTWSELKALRDNSQLVAGQLYRITDYITTTVQTDTQSANHQFDIIVLALNDNTLSEDAGAIQHEGDTYFNGQKLETWKLKYRLDNDTTRFAWADTVNGKGVIYGMIDNRNNSLHYDFKNIQSKNSYRTDRFYYTFDYNGNDASLQTGVELNNIKEYYVNWRYQIPKNIFIGNDFRFNNISFNSTGNTILNGFKNNMVGNGFANNTIGTTFENNMVGNGFANNTLGQYSNGGFGNNIIGNDFINNIINGEEESLSARIWSWNIVGNNVQYITFTGIQRQGFYIPNNYRGIASSPKTLFPANNTTYYLNQEQLQL